MVSHKSSKMSKTMSVEFLKKYPSFLHIDTWISMMNNTPCQFERLMFVIEFFRPCTFWKTKRQVVLGVDSKHIDKAVKCNEIEGIIKPSKTFVNLCIKNPKIRKIIESNNEFVEWAIISDFQVPVEEMERCLYDILLIYHKNKENSEGDWYKYLFCTNKNIERFLSKHLELIDWNLISKHVTSHRLINFFSRFPFHINWKLVAENPMLGDIFESFICYIHLVDQYILLAYKEKIKNLTQKEILNDLKKYREMCTRESDFFSFYEILPYLLNTHKSSVPFLQKWWDNDIKLLSESFSVIKEKIINYSSKNRLLEMMENTISIQTYTNNVLHSQFDRIIPNKHPTVVYGFPLYLIENKLKKNSAIFLENIDWNFLYSNPSLIFKLYNIIVESMHLKTPEKIVDYIQEQLWYYKNIHLDSRCNLSIVEIPYIDFELD